MGYENLKRNLNGLWIFGEKNYISFRLVPGINNDQSLSLQDSRISRIHILLNFEILFLEAYRF